MFDVSVVICAYTEERWNDLVAAVQSVQRQSTQPREIIVVIDHNQRLLERVQAQMPGVIVVENRQLPGASGARNCGVAIAKGEIVAFLDDDAEAMPDWLERLTAGYTDPAVLGIGGFLEPIWLSRQPTWFPAEFYWALGCSHSGMPKSTAPIRNLICANMSLRRDVFEAVNGFRDGFGKVGTRFSAEETDLCIRALQKWPQRVWLYEPAAKIRHKVSASRASWRFYLSRCYDEGIGKARLSRMVGAADSLSNEYWYTFHILPQAFLRGLGDAAFRRDLSGLGRAAAIAAGFAATAFGYIVGAVRERLTGQKRLNRSAGVREARPLA